MLSSSLYVQGDRVYGAATVSAECMSGGAASTVGISALTMSGTIAGDGSFQASSGPVGDARTGSFSLSLTGDSPLAATPLTWAGSYSLTFTPGTTGGSCAIAQQSKYAAVAIAPVTGSYSGTPLGAGYAAFGAEATVSLQMTQGAPIAVMRGDVSSYEIPLTASLTIGNSACAAAVSTAGGFEGSRIEGSQLHLTFAVPNSPGGGLEGTLDSVAANSFVADLTSMARALGCSGGVVARYEFVRGGA